MGKYLKHIWQEYSKRYTLYSGITAGILLLQIIHLYWLFAHVITLRLFGEPFFSPSQFWQFIIIIVDYIEIPAIVSTSFLYIYSLSQKWSRKDFFLLLLLNTQWLHIFWVTDEFAESVFLGVAHSTVLPFWLAWVAIGIDYLELPVMYDTFKKFMISLRQKEGN